MTPERAFIIWFSTRQGMVVKKYRPEIRAHMMKALGSPIKAKKPTKSATTEHFVDRHI